VLEDLICIADLVIVSNPACSLQYSTRLVLESQVPMIVAIDPTVADWMPETPLMKWYQSRETLVGQLNDWIIHRSQWEAEAIALRRHYQRHHPNEHWLDRWSNLFAQAVWQSESTSAENRFQ
jgi:alpha-beta hydrolase superfamily lysophospholipase